MTGVQTCALPISGWLEFAGVKVPKKVDGSLDCEIEMAASFAVCKEDVKEKLAEIPQMRTGGKYYLE